MHPSASLRLLLGSLFGLSLVTLLLLASPRRDGRLGGGVKRRSLLCETDFDPFDCDDDGPVPLPTPPPTPPPPASSPTPSPPPCYYGPLRGRNLLIGDDCVDIDCNPVVIPGPEYKDPNYLTITGCNNEEAKRIKFAVAYMRAASTSAPFTSCVQTAVNSRVFLQTSHEVDASTGQTSPFVGPYDMCDMTGTPSDPDYSSQTTVAQVAITVAQRNTGRRPITIVCHDSRAPLTAVSPTDGITNRWLFELNPTTARTHELGFNSLIFDQYPFHVNGESIDPLFGCLGPSYPVDELAGLVLHEMLHNIWFHHGDPPNSACGYTTTALNGFNCDGIAGNSCRMSSLNEIAEGCMSEIVQQSTDNCNVNMCESTAPGVSYRLPLFLNGVCTCTSYW